MLDPRRAAASEARASAEMASRVAVSVAAATASQLRQLSPRPPRSAASTRNAQSDTSIPLPSLPSACTTAVLPWWEQPLSDDDIDDDDDDQPRTQPFEFESDWMHPTPTNESALHLLPQVRRVPQVAEHACSSGVNVLPMEAAATHATASEDQVLLRARALTSNVEAEARARDEEATRLLAAADVQRRRHLHQ